MPKLKGTASNVGELSAHKDVFAGAWGRINPTPHSAITLRVAKTPTAKFEEAFSYPYRTLSTWTWRRLDRQEEIKIEAGPDLIVVRGRGLALLVEALDSGALESIIEGTDTNFSSEGATVITFLIVEKSGSSEPQPDRS
jgi:hypothetical protein